MPTCNRAGRLATFIALGNDQRLLFRRPTTPTSSPGEHLDPSERRRGLTRVRLKQKLSVRHVSKPLRLRAGTMADQIKAMRTTDRLQSSYVAVRLCAVVRAGGDLA